MSAAAIALGLDPTPTIGRATAWFGLADAQPISLALPLAAAGAFAFGRLRLAPRATAT
jgi:hypothetical protein